MSKTTQYKGIAWRKGKKVILRPYLESDLPLFQHWINDVENNQFLNITWPMHEGGQRKWFDENIISDPDKIGVAICTHDGTLIGNMGMGIDAHKQSAVTGTLIGPHDYQGKGYATDAKMLILEYAFNWRAVRKVTSPIIDFNGRSQTYAQSAAIITWPPLNRSTFDAENGVTKNCSWSSEKTGCRYGKNIVPGNGSLVGEKKRILVNICGCRGVTFGRTPFFIFFHQLFSMQ